LFFFFKCDTAEDLEKVRGKATSQSYWTKRNRSVFRFSCLANLKPNHSKLALNLKKTYQVSLDDD